MIDQFNLVDPGILDVQGQLTVLRETVGQLNDQLTQGSGGSLPGRQVPNDAALRSRLAEMSRIIETVRGMIDRVQTNNLPAARQDIDLVAAAVPQRREQLLRMREKFAGDPARYSDYDNLDPCQTGPSCRHRPFCL